MSTRATVWIRNDEEDISVFLYHHCDGYGLDEDIDPVLKNLPDDAWNVADIQDAIQALEFGDSYKRVQTVGWDSEYVYKISVDERKMYKYYTGIGDPHDEANFESRLTELERTYEYQPEKWEDEPKEELSPLAAKLKEIVNSYDEDHSMTNEGAEFYASQLRSLNEDKKEVRCELDEYPDPTDFQGINASVECKAHQGDCANCPHNLGKEMRVFDVKTLSQVIKIELMDIVKFCLQHVESGSIKGSDVEKVQRMFNIVHEK